MRYLQGLLITSLLLSFGTHSVLAGNLPSLDHKKVSGLLVNSNGEMVKKDLKKKKFVLIYFSLYGTEPGRNFTRKLIKFYKDNRKGDNFDVIFFSFDENEQNMKRYMKEMGMPWPAIDYNKRKESGLRGFSGEATPFLNLIDEEGDSIGNGMQNDVYIGPEEVLKQLKERLDEMKAESGEAEVEEEKKPKKKKRRRRHKKSSKKKSKTDD